MLWILVFLFSFFTKPIFAADEFNISQNFTYTAEENGNAFVDQKIKLTNNFSEIYPKEYQFKILGANIENIRAIDKSGNILQKIEKQNESTTVFLKFNSASLGKNKTTEFNLLYSLPQFALHKGNTWEISLPEYKNNDNNNEISVNLNVPSSFGKLSFSSINSPSINNVNNQTQIQIADIKNQKLLFTFGSYQIFDFNFKYFLNNQESIIAKTEIAIPPQTESQTIIIKEINPLPSNIRVDQDGNWLAQYELKPQEDLEINISGQAKIFSPVNNPTTVDSKNLIQEKKFWPVSNPEILTISKNLKNPKEIYDYVVNNLNYNYDGLNSSQRKGAANALLFPNESLCTEFTDLFVTLARSKNIPAREIEGFAYTNNPKIKPISLNTDILHAWPQYYDLAEKKWVSIDPTWAKTTNGIDYFNDLDLNHFAFVIHGQDSQYPLPPGSYRSNNNSKTVNVNFATAEIKETFLPPQIISEKKSFKSNQKIIVQNPNPNALNKISLSLPSQNWQKNIDLLPPFASIEINIPAKNFFQSLLPQNQKNNFLVKYQNSETPIWLSTPYLPHFLNLAIFITVLILILSLSGIILTIQKKPKKK